jgi:heme oxygenase
MPTIPDPSRAKRLKAATAATHDRLDQAVMAATPFANRARYGRFLALQHRFHRDLAPLYARADLLALLPDLAERQRLDQVVADLEDLDLPSSPAAADAPVIDDLPTALGWLYVAEGSNLGAAILYKAVAPLGCDADFGARHLAGHPDGRAAHWRSFTAALDAVSLTDAEEERVVAGAVAAFARVRSHLAASFDGPGALGEP